MTRLDSVTAFAPATAGNAGVGFDVLGFAFEGVGDRVTVAFAHEPQPGPLRIVGIEGVVENLPWEAEANTATVALLHLLTEVGGAPPLTVRLDKGIALGSGMGGSAASAVAAVVAANELLGLKLSNERLLACAMAAEQVASGASHPDNAAPCLLGGMVAVLSRPLRLLRIPVPGVVRCVLVHPRIRVDTAQARAVLRAELALGDHVRQTARLVCFVAACFRGDLETIGETMRDEVVEPQRTRLVPGFPAAREAAQREGALGFCLSGSGPSVFAWARNDQQAQNIGREVRAAFGVAGLESDMWVGPIRRRGAQVVAHSWGEG